MIISNGGIERILGPHLQKIYKSNSVEQARPAGKADSVSISPAARLAQAARTALQSVPEVREDRVNALREAISRGEYNPSDQDIAASMMRRRV